MKERDLPGDLKNAVCCLKCRKVGVDAVRKKMPGLSRGYDRCKICKSYAYRYIEITTSPIIFVVLTVMVIWVMPVSEDGSRPIVVIGIWISIMCGVYLNNLSKRKKIRRLLEEHTQAAPSQEEMPPQKSMGDDIGMRLLLPVGRSGWAIAAGYLGLFGLVLVPAPLALIVSIIAIRDIQKSKNTQKPKHGMGRAVFGLIVGIFGTLALVLLAAEIFKFTG